MTTAMMVDCGTSPSRSPPTAAERRGRWLWLLPGFGVAGTSGGPPGLALDASSKSPPQPVHLPIGVGARPGPPGPRAR